MRYEAHMRDHWANCILHHDDDVNAFIESYFAREDRRVLLVAAAGFDPRANHVTQQLSATLADRLSAIFVREERPNPSDNLIERANVNEALLRGLVPDSEVIQVDVFADDGAPVGGHRVSSELIKRPLDDGITDVILDFSALSLGVAFPAARLLLEACEGENNRAFHIMISSNPELDDQIRSDPSDRPSPVKGFAPEISDEDYGDAVIWVPQLAHGRLGTLAKIGTALGDFYKVCPLLPFPAKNPRRSDDLVTEFQSALVDEWNVDPRDFVHASEWNPLDCYRRLSRLKLRFDRTMEGTYVPRMVLSPIGSKVLATGALMAAIEHNMAVQYVETDSYLLADNEEQPVADNLPDPSLVHLVLSGPLYSEFPKRNVSPSSAESSA